MQKRMHMRIKTTKKTTKDGVTPALTTESKFSEVFQLLDFTNFNFPPKFSLKVGKSQRVISIWSKKLNQVTNSKHFNLK